MKAFALFLLLRTGLAAPPLVPENWEQIAAGISEQDLRENLQFLSSDALEGRSTPSAGQDKAAEFIAAQFRQANLEPPVNGTYFQDADFGEWVPRTDGLRLSFSNGPKQLAVAADQFRLQAFCAVALDSIPLVIVGPDADLTADLAGKAVFWNRPGNDGYQQLIASKPALLLRARPRLGERARRVWSLEEAREAIPTLLLDAKAADEVRAGFGKDAVVSLHAEAPAFTRIRARNVVGLLPGSDPELKQQFILVTAHYDHLAIRQDGPDRIYNGANDDGSGTVSVIEIARALSALPVKPRRSIVFMTFFGEELGLLGSRYYGKHPVFPLGQTVAQVNLEQLGRTSAKEGFPADAFTLTGFEFTDLPGTFQAAAAVTGVNVFSTPDSDQYFARSDNQALADVGVPANTIAVAYTFPDYHKVSDEWQKIEFQNMAKVDRALAVGLAAVANRSETPAWNRRNPKTERYWRAFDQLHPPAAEP